MPGRKVLVEHSERVRCCDIMVTRGDELLARCSARYKWARRNMPEQRRGNHSGTALGSSVWGTARGAALARKTGMMYSILDGGQV